MLTKLIINTYFTNHYKCLGFNTYNKTRIENTNNPIKIKKIHAQNCNKTILEKIVLNHIKLQPNVFYYIHNNNLYLKYINDLLKKLKSSGYISRIHIFNVNTKNNKYITLNIKTNPVVKKITITNYKRLKIPSYFLKDVFRKHLGMPKNYHLINESFNKIYSWYKSKGYAWINIELIEQDILNTNNIVFSITEGLVKNVELVCQTKNIYNPQLLETMNSLIKQELGIYSGGILNINTIERGIRHLTNLHLIQDCNYIIKRDKKQFIAVIKYNIYKNNTVYYYNYHSILNNYSNYKQIYTLISKYLTHHKFFNRYHIYRQKTSVYSSIIQIDQALKYKYKSFYYNNTINSFFIHLAILKKYPHLKIIFSHPYIQNQNKTFSHLRINLYNKIIKNQLCYPFIILDLNKLIISQKSNLLTYLYSYIFSIKHNFINGISILEKSKFIYSKLIQINLCIKDYKTNPHIKNKLFQQDSLINIKKLFKYIKYQLIYLKISIKNDNSYLLNRPKTGPFISVSSKIFTYIKTYYNNNRCKLTYLGQSIQIQYMQAFNLPQMFNYIYYHTFVILSELHFLFNSNIYETMLNGSYNQINHISFKGNQEKKSTVYFFYIFNIEYHISKVKHLSIYCFWNYITYLSNQKQEKPYIKALNNSPKYNTQIGLGVKFYIPIKKLPNIKLEYSLNNNGEYFLRLCTDSKYNN